jgi:phosphoenolpyruvate carboxykinase (GTP)
MDVKGEKMTVSNLSRRATESLMALDAVPEVREFALEWINWTNAADVEVITSNTPGELAVLEDRLISEAIEAGEIVELLDDNGNPTQTYWATSHPEDTARMVPRTFVATHSEEGRGVMNNWRHHDDAWAKVRGLSRDGSTGKTHYVIPYCMSSNINHPLGSKFGVGVEITDSRYVALSMIRMARVGAEALEGIRKSIAEVKARLSKDDLDDAELGQAFVRAVNITGNLDELNRSNDEDDHRWFVTFPDNRYIVHHGSAYGGNALLGKIAHGLRLASADAQRNHWLAEQQMIIGVKDKMTGETRYVVGAYPSASGKTNTAAMAVPKSLEHRFEVTYLGDDIAWMYVGDDNRLYAMNPEYGAFGVAIDTRRDTAPNLMDAVGPGTGTIWTNVAFNHRTRQIWYEGMGKDFPVDLDGWVDYTGKQITDRPVDQQRCEDVPWAHPNSRFTTPLVRRVNGTEIKNVPNLDDDWNNPLGVPVSLILFGGRVPTREPLIRLLETPQDGVYDGFVMGVVKTAAVEDAAGKFGPDPMTMGAFFGPAETPYIQNWLEIMDRMGANAPAFAHINYFLRWSGFEGKLDELNLSEAYENRESPFLWPGYGWNVLEILWAMRAHEGHVQGVNSPIGTIPADFLNFEEWLGLSADEANEVRQELAGRNVTPEVVDALFHFDADAWEAEAKRRTQFLEDFPNMPPAFKAAHERFVKRSCAS